MTYDFNSSLSSSLFLSSGSGILLWEKTEKFSAGHLEADTIIKKWHATFQKYNSLLQTNLLKTISSRIMSRNTIFWQISLELWPFWLCWLSGRLSTDSKFIGWKTACPIITFEKADVTSAYHQSWKWVQVLSCTSWNWSFSLKGLNDTWTTDYKWMDRCDSWNIIVQLLLLKANPGKDLHNQSM